MTNAMRKRYRTPIVLAILGGAFALAGFALFWAGSAHAASIDRRYDAMDRTVVAPGSVELARNSYFVQYLWRTEINGVRTHRSEGRPTVEIAGPGGTFQAHGPGWGPSFSTDTTAGVEIGYFFTSGGTVTISFPDGVPAGDPPVNRFIAWHGDYDATLA